MARRYVNPNGQTVVTDRLLAEGRSKAEAAAVRLHEAEHANPADPGWDGDYAAATVAAQAASRRVEALERLRAAQLERGGKREAAVKAAAGDLKSIAAGLAATRDAVAVAAAAHLKALAALAVATDQHNARLAEGRALLAERGLRVRDDLLDEGQEHAEGTLDGPGLRAGAVDWTPVPLGGIAAHALRTVFGGLGCGPLHPLTDVGKYTWRSFEVEARADGLKVPGLKDAGAVLPPAPPAPAVARRAEVEQHHPPAPLPGGYYRDPPPRRMAGRIG